MSDKFMFVNWPFWQCQAMLPEAMGNDMFVWLYLSLVVYNNTTKKKKNPYAFSEETQNDVRALLKSKFSLIMDDVLLTNIEERIKKDFCDENEQYKQFILRKEVESFLDTFESLFSKEIELKFIYKDAVTGAICPFFEEIEVNKDNYKVDYSFDSSVLRNKEPSTKLVLKALSLSKAVKNSTDPLVSLDAKETIISEIANADDEEMFVDDTLDFGDSEENQTPEEEKGRSSKKSVKILDDSYSKINLMVAITKDDNGQFHVCPPNGIEDNDAIEGWFNTIFRKTYLSNESFSKAVNAFFPEEQREIKKENMMIFSESQSLQFTQELFEAVSHSKFLRNELIRESIFINDNFHGNSGFFYVGRMLDLLGRTIPDEVLRTNTSKDMFDALMKDAVQQLGLSSVSAYKLCGPSIFSEYTRKKKRPDQLAFKELLANAILNNMACSSSPYIYPEVVEDAWYLYDSRSDVDHVKKSKKLCEDDIKKLTKLAKFIISIQGGKIYE